MLATIPAVAFGLFLKKFGLGDLERSVTIVAWNTVIYGILMLIADMIGRQEKTIENMTLKSALFIGAAGGALFGLILAVNTVGDAIRDVLDPRTLRDS